MTFDVKKIREDFPILKREVNGKPLIYLDNAASTLKPQVVIDTIANHYQKDSANVHRGIHFLSEQGTRQFEESRRFVQNYINAESYEEVIFTKGTTESINLASFSFGGAFVKEGDVILVSELEHHSNIVPWQLMAERKGAIIKKIPINDLGEIMLDEYQKLLGPEVKMVAVNHISNSLGTINPVYEMTRLAHEHGAKILIDAAQSASHIHIDVQLLDCDFLAFSAHKTLGPTGVGVLYGKKELLEEMPPYQGGGEMIESVSFEGTTFNRLPFKFEAGTPHIAGVIALKKALEYIEKIGFDAIKTQENELLRRCMKQLEEVEGIRFIGEAKAKTAVISFVMEGAHAHDVGTLLDQQGIAVRTGQHCTQPVMDHFKVPATIRASFAFYNTEAEVDQFVAAIKRVKEFI